MSMETFLFYSPTNFLYECYWIWKPSYKLFNVIMNFSVEILCEKTLTQGTYYNLVFFWRSSCVVKLTGVYFTDVHIFLQCHQEVCKQADTFEFHLQLEMPRLDLERCCLYSQWMCSWKRRQMWRISVGTRIYVFQNRTKFIH